MYFLLRKSCPRQVLLFDDTHRFHRASFLLHLQQVNARGLCAQVPFRHRIARLQLALLQYLPGKAEQADSSFRIEALRKPQAQAAGSRVGK